MLRLAGFRAEMNQFVEQQRLAATVTRALGIAPLTSALPAAPQMDPSAHARVILTAAAGPY